MWTKSEDVNVTKLVVLVARIPKHFDLHFYDFSTNFYAFSKFAVLSSSTICRLDPVTLVSFNWRSLVTVQNRGGEPRQFPAGKLTGGEG